MVTSILEPEPEKRLTIAEIRKNEYFDSIVQDEKVAEASKYDNVVLDFMEKSGEDRDKLISEIDACELTPLTLKYELFCNQNARGEFIVVKKDRRSLVGSSMSPRHKRVPSTIVEPILEKKSLFVVDLEEASKAKEESEVKKQNYSSKFKELSSSLREMSKTTKTSEVGVRFSTKVRASYKKKASDFNKGTRPETAKSSFVGTKTEANDDDKAFRRSMGNLSQHNSPAKKKVSLETSMNAGNRTSKFKKTEGLTLSELMANEVDTSTAHKAKGSNRYSMLFPK